jgi:epoxyqueuosine reductase
MSSFDELQRECELAGFPLAGVVDLDLAHRDFQPHAKRYQEWIDRGYHGEMAYLSRGLDRRRDPRLVFPQTQSILCVARPTRRTPLGSVDPSVGPRLARYTEGRDYHDSMKKDLEGAIESYNRARNSSGEPTLQYKVCVDTSAVLERSWAALAGLGWIGKNTLLIHPKLGSYLLLGVALLDRKFDMGPKPLASYCGSCTRCLRSCPTEALAPEGWLDSRKCIAYLTLEKRGDWDSSVQREKMGTWIAGCDLCQEACPFNFKPEREARQISTETESTLTWEALLRESEDEYKARVKNSALSRVKPEMAKRNLEQAFKNGIKDKESEPC